MKRADLDGAVEVGELVVIPAVRGCIYLVPAADAPDALAYAVEIARPRTGRELEKAGPTGTRSTRSVRPCSWR